MSKAFSPPLELFRADGTATLSTVLFLKRRREALEDIHQRRIRGIGHDGAIARGEFLEEHVPCVGIAVISQRFNGAFPTGRIRLVLDDVQVDLALDP